MDNLLVNHVSHNKVLDLMSMHPYDREDREQEAIKCVRWVAARLGKTPTVVEFKREATKIRYDAIIGMFGTWNETLRRAGLDPNPSGQPPRNDKSKEEIVAELIRVANQLGKFPSHPEFSARATMSRRPVERTFGSWRNAKTYIATHYADELQFRMEVPEDADSRDLGVSKGLSIDVPLKFVPRNEMETIVLFSMLCEELGYQVVRAQVEYPDLIVEKDGRKYNVEVEYVSSNYLQHGHPLNEGTICLCWRKDVEIPGVEIIDLESYVRERSNKRMQPTAKRGG